MAAIEHGEATIEANREGHRGIAGRRIVGGRRRGRKSLDQLSRREIRRMQALFNDRSRKILNWHSPAHAFHQLLR
jgi:hypothetical protein